MSSSVPTVLPLTPPASPRRTSITSVTIPSPRANSAPAMTASTIPPPSQMSVPAVGSAPTSVSIPAPSVSSASRSSTPVSFMSTPAPSVSPLSSIPAPSASSIPTPSVASQSSIPAPSVSSTSSIPVSPRSSIPVASQLSIPAPTAAVVSVSVPPVQSQPKSSILAPSSSVSIPAPSQQPKSLNQAQTIPLPSQSSIPPPSQLNSSIPPPSQPGSSIPPPSSPRSAIPVPASINPTIVGSVQADMLLEQQLHAAGFGVVKKYMIEGKVQFLKVRSMLGDDVIVEMDHVVDKKLDTTNVVEHYDVTKYHTTEYVVPEMISEFECSMQKANCGMAYECSNGMCVLTADAQKAPKPRMISVNQSEGLAKIEHDSSYYPVLSLAYLMNNLADSLAVIENIHQVGLVTRELRRLRTQAKLKVINADAVAMAARITDLTRTYNETQAQLAQTVAKLDTLRHGYDSMVASGVFGTTAEQSASNKAKYEAILTNLESRSKFARKVDTIINKLLKVEPQIQGTSELLDELTEILKAQQTRLNFADFNAE